MTQYPARAGLMALLLLAGCTRSDVPGRCVAASECPGSAVCVDGECLQGCVTASDCPEETPVCRRGGCVAGEVECRTTADCTTPTEGDPACFDGTCEGWTCRYQLVEGRSCGEPTCDGDEALAERFCTAAGACPEPSRESCAPYAC